jgi:hypothetical protein
VQQATRQVPTEPLLQRLKLQRHRPGLNKFNSLTLRQPTFVSVGLTIPLANRANKSSAIALNTSGSCCFFEYSFEKNEHESKVKKFN